MLELWPTLISYALFMHHPIAFRGAGDVHGMLRVDPKLVLEDLRSDKSHRSVRDVDRSTDHWFFWDFPARHVGI
jgi:hypothetical protein